MAVSRDTRDAVRAAYDRRCGYCGVSEIWAGGELDIDHFRPLMRGGTDDIGNLVYACPPCNRFKSDYWPDAAAPDSFHLLHPSRDELALHLAEAADGHLVGLTPRGWFYIRWLHLNRPQLVLRRQLLKNEHELREVLTQAEQARNRLQARIRELENEVATLQDIIAGLSGEQ